MDKDTYFQDAEIKMKLPYLYMGITIDQGAEDVVYNMNVWEKAWTMYPHWQERRVYDDELPK